jgi:rubrerythrin
MTFFDRVMSGGGAHRGHRQRRTRFGGAMTTLQCPVCGEWIDDQSNDYCPTCGEAISPDDSADLTR